MAYLYCLLGILDSMLSSILDCLAGELEVIGVDDDGLERTSFDRKLVAFKFIHVVQTPRRLSLPSINMSCDRGLHNSTIVHVPMYFLHTLVQQLPTPLNLVFLDSHAPRRIFDLTAIHLRAFLTSTTSFCGTQPTSGPSLFATSSD